MQRKHQRAVIALGLPLATGSLVLTGCTGGSSTTGTGSSSGGGKGTLTLVETADIQGWDPANQPSYQNWTAPAVFDSLLRCDEHNNPSPAVAQTWKVNKESTGITLHLKSGLKFSDGTALDSAAVKASFEHVEKSPNSSRYANLKITTPDSSTVTITWPDQQPLIVRKICDAWLASPKWLAGGKLNGTPVGSGPYVLDSSATTRGSVYTFTRNPSYRDPKAFPYQKLVVKIMTSETAAVNALKTGQVDGTLITQASYNEAKTSGLGIATMSGNTTRLLITDHLGKKVPALGKLDVRRAINMVFDKEAMANKLYQGHATPASQIFRPGTSAYIKGLKDPYPYNVAEAKKLMARAGYASGFTVQIPYMQGVGLDALLPYVTQQLKLIGITVKQVTLSGPNAISELLSGKYPMPLWQLGNYGDPLQDIQDYALQDGIWNVEHQKDAKIAELWTQILGGDKEQRIQAEQAVNRYITDQAWFAPMVYPQNFYAYSKRVSIPEITDFSQLNPQLWDFK
ncbi:ABC transporter substrate-binding protein [Streptomyces sp. NPDC004237]|uniref:ABC transporter substrate-binding protein n=1 Tax=Streptomyces sp. NPDC004237 TaxID=3154455 RepID=UPI0033A1565E